MTQYIPTISFIAGMIVCLCILCFGMYIGWKASYSIRNHREELAEDNGQIFKTSQDPGEFDLIEQEEKEEEEFEKNE